MMRLVIVLAAFLPSACQGDETISGYSDRDAIWVLQEIDGTPFPARATIRFPDEGRVAGAGPCNAFGASQTLPLPWIEITGLRATRRMCPEADAERLYFETLTGMTLAETSGDVLILTNDVGTEMVFRSE